MELSYRELRRREVISVTDGASLGKICDIVLSFPQGIMTGIVVPGKRGKGLFGFFNRNELFIDQRKIIKIGNDVILVDLKGGAGGTKPKKPQPQPCPPPPCNPCPPQCNTCAPPYPRQALTQEEIDIDFDEY